MPCFDVVNARAARWLRAAFLTLMILLGPLTRAEAAPESQSGTPGETVFQQKCAACHTIGGGKLVGPDLQGTTARREADWLKRMIAAPDKLLASGDPLANQLLKEYNNIPMPNLGLTAREVEELMAFLATRDDGAAPAATAPGSATSTVPASSSTAAVLALTGSADAGQRIFDGAARLQNGGMSCIACHSAEGVGPLGGGTLGPDLTQVQTRYGREGLAAALGSLPYPSMLSIFADKPLTPAEQADLLAFFAATSQQGEPSTRQNLLITVGVGSGLAGTLFLGITFFWPRQRLSIAQRLRKNGKL